MRNILRRKFLILLKKVAARAGYRRSFFRNEYFLKRAPVRVLVHQIEALLQKIDGRKYSIGKVDLMYAWELYAQEMGQGDDKYHILFKNNKEESYD